MNPLQSFFSRQSLYFLVPSVSILPTPDDLDVPGLRRRGEDVYMMPTYECNGRPTWYCGVDPSIWRGPAESSSVVPLEGLCLMDRERGKPMDMSKALQGGLSTVSKVFFLLGCVAVHFNLNDTRISTRWREPSWGRQGTIVNSIFIWEDPRSKGRSME